MIIGLNFILRYDNDYKHRVKKKKKWKQNEEETNPNWVYLDHPNWASLLLHTQI